MSSMKHEEYEVPSLDETVQATAHETSERKDSFLLHPPSQPKKEIADMLESRGILVPKRFESLADALGAIRQGREVIIRSEHPREYAEAAGLLASHVVTAERVASAEKACEETGAEIDWECFEKRGFVPGDKIFGFLGTTAQAAFEENLKRLYSNRIREYCRLLGLNEGEFRNGISYSYWEKIGGFNRSIIVDSAIPGRYHIFASRGKTYCNYTIVDNGQLVLDKPEAMTDELRAGVERVIAFYEKIRNTEGFDPSHCPLIEFQTYEGTDYFLQYHRTRDTKSSSWRLERAPGQGECEASFVRGATSPEGIVLNVAMFYPREYEGYGSQTLLEAEDGSFDINAVLHTVFSEIMSRRRRASFHQQSLDTLAISTFAHLTKSSLFNPEISIGISKSDMPPELSEKLSEKTEEEGIPATIKIRVVSDGRKAYIKFFDSEE